MSLHNFSSGQYPNPRVRLYVHAVRGDDILKAELEMQDSDWHEIKLGKLHIERVFGYSKKSPIITEWIFDALAPTQVFVRFNYKPKEITATYDGSDDSFLKQDMATLDPLYGIFAGKLSELRPLYADEE